MEAMTSHDPDIHRPSPAPSGRARPVGRPTTATVRTLAVSALALLVLGALAHPPRAALFTAVAGGAEARPSLHGAVEFTAEAGLLVLVAVVGLLAVRTLLRDRPGFVLLVACGIGTIGAYLSSEVLKLVFSEDRPCRTVLTDVVLTCPAPGDFAFPSNHSVIAAALATSCVLVVPRLWPLVVPVALLIGASRVLAGVHYVHDVCVGLAWGTAVTLVLALLLHRLLLRTVLAPGSVERHPALASFAS